MLIWKTFAQGKGICEEFQSFVVSVVMNLSRIPMMNSVRILGADVFN